MIIKTRRRGTYKVTLDPFRICANLTVFVITAVIAVITYAWVIAGFEAAYLMCYALCLLVLSLLPVILHLRRSIEEYEEEYADDQAA